MAYLTLNAKRVSYGIFQRCHRLEVVTPTSDNEMENGVIPTPKIPEIPEKVDVPHWEKSAIFVQKFEFYEKLKKIFLVSYFF